MYTFLNANGQFNPEPPLSEEQKAEIKPYAKLTEGTLAGISAGFARATPHPVLTEFNISKAATEELKGDPETYNEYQSQIQKNVGPRAVGRFPHPAFQAKSPEEFLPHYDRDELTAQLMEEGIWFDRDIAVPKEGLTLARAKEFQRIYEEQKENEEILANSAPGLSSWVANFAGLMIGSMADPVNLIPFGGAIGGAGKSVARGTKILSEASIKAASKAAGRGAVENVAASALADAAVFPYANQWGAGLTWQDFYADIGIGGVLGGALGGLGNLLGRWTTAGLHQDAQVRALADDKYGRSIDVSSIVKEKLDEVQRLNPDWNRNATPTNTAQNLTAFLTRREAMKMQAAVNSRPDVESSIASLKEHVVSARDERVSLESDISMAMHRSAEIEIGAADEIRILEVRRDASMDEARIELQEQIDYIQRTESPAMVERSIQDARNKMEPAIGDVFRRFQWEIEGIRKQAREAAIAQDARAEASRLKLSDVRARQLKAIGEVGVKEKELATIDRIQAEITAAAKVPVNLAAGQISFKTLGEPIENVQARERTKATKDSRAPGKKSGEVDDTTPVADRAETALREAEVERLESLGVLSENLAGDLRIARAELRRANDQQNVLMAAADCIIKKGL